jgi:solute carrier family 12 (potassium/chloride transporters), member 9
MDEMGPKGPQKTKLGVVNGVFIPVVLNIISILMFLRFGSILGRIGLLGMLGRPRSPLIQMMTMSLKLSAGLLVAAYFIDLVTALSLSAIASNGEVKGGGAYYLISRSLGPEFGGSIGILFYLSQVLNTALNVVGLIDCLRLNIDNLIPGGYWEGYLMESCVLVVCTCLCLAGSGIFARASNALLVVLVVATISIPVSSLIKAPFKDAEAGVDFTGPSAKTLASNIYPHKLGPHYRGFETFRELFGILFPATSGIFAGASMSGDLRNPSKAIPTGTLWAMLSTFVLYLVVIMSMASSVTHASFLRETNILSAISIWKPIIVAGECATTLFSVLMGIIASAKLLQALARDKLLPGLSPFGRGTKGADEPILAVVLTYMFVQAALFADLNQIATLISMGYQVGSDQPSSLRTHTGTVQLTNICTGDLLRDEPGLFPAQDRIGSELSTGIQALQLADCVHWQYSFGRSDVLHRGDICCSG